MLVFVFIGLHRLFISLKAEQILEERFEDFMA